MPEQVKVEITRGCKVAGKSCKIGEIVECSAPDAARLIYSRMAKAAVAKPAKKKTAAKKEDA